MRRGITIAVLTFVLAGWVRAQEPSRTGFEVSLPKPRGIEPVQAVETRPSIEGIVKNVFETRRPWQMVNPAAPAHYGSGQRVVSKDFGGGTPVHSAGVVVLGVEW